MKKHLLSLRYDGLDAATHHGIGTAGSKQVIGGAQILLGTTAGKASRFSMSDAARARSSSTSRC
jgi:hypothetical protein